MKRKLHLYFIVSILIFLTAFAGCSGFSSKDDSDIVIGKANKLDGILINKVQKGGPAEKAGIQDGDVIVSYDGKQITDMENLKKEIEEAPPGKKVILEVVRNDSLFNVSISFKKKGWQIVNVDPTNEFPNYSINVIDNFLWIGTYPYPVELRLEERMLLPYGIFDADHIPADPPTFFTITVR